MSTSPLAHLKACEAELREALHAVDALSDRARMKGGPTTAGDLNGILSRLATAAVHLRAAGGLPQEEEAGVGPSGIE